MSSPQGIADSLSGRKVNRRKTLKVLAALGVSSAVPTRATAQTNDQVNADPQLGDQSTVTANGENVKDYGAVGDGSTDDTQAIVDAADAAGPGGKVYFPKGTYLVGSNTDYPFEYPMDGSWDNLTWEGEDHSETTILMDGGKSGWHIMFLAESSDGSQVGDMTFNQLTFDLNQSQQSTSGGSHWCDVRDGNGTLTVRDCVVKNTLNAGLNLKDEMAGSVRYCYFKNCGDPEASFGHAIKPIQSSRQSTIIADCHFEDPAGNAVKVGQVTENDYASVDINNCYIRAGRGALKLNPENDRTTIRNTKIVGSDRTTVGIRTNYQDKNCGSVELDNVVMDGLDWPALDFATGSLGDVVMRQTAFRNVCQDSARDAGIYADSGRFNAGTISIHNVGPNNNDDAVRFTKNARGTIRELRHDGTGGLGDTGDVTIASAVDGGSEVTPDVPEASDVGPRPS